MNNPTTIICTEDAPSKLDTSTFKYSARTVTINGIMYVREGQRTFPRGYWNLDSAQRVATSHGGDAAVVRFGCCYAVALGLA